MGTQLGIADTIRAEMLASEWSLAGLAEKYQCSVPNLMSHRDKLKDQGHHFAKEKRGMRTYYHHVVDACLPGAHNGNGITAEQKRNLPVHVPGAGTKADRARERFLSGEPVSIIALAREVDSPKGHSWVGKARRQLANDGHHFNTERRGHETFYCHVPEKCAAGLHDNASVAVAAVATAVTQRAVAPPQSARLPFVPNLGAGLQVTLLRLNPVTGQVTIGVSDGDNEYITDHTGTLQVGDGGL